MRRNALILKRGDEFNPEGRCGEPKQANGKRYFHCWFTYESFLSYATERIMDALVAAKVITRRRSNRTVLYERNRYVYYRAGRFYRTRSNKNERREGSCYELEPLTGTVVSCYPKYQARHGLPDATIQLKDGYPFELVMDGDTIPVEDGMWPSLEGWLGLDEHYKPMKYWPEGSMA